MTAELQSIIERLGELEKQNRRMKQAGVAGLVLACLLLTLGVAGPDRVIEAEKFILKDSSGKTRAVLSNDATGTDLRFLDEKGTQRLSVGMYAGNPNITMFNSDSKQVATLASDMTGSELWLGEGAFGKPLVTIGTELTLGKENGPAFTPFLRLRDGKGHDRIGLEFSPMFEEASINVQSENGKDGVNLSAADTYGSTLIVGTKGSTASLSSDKEGPALSLTDQRGYSASLGSVSLVTKATGESHRTSAASVVLFDKDKNVIWRAP